MRDVVIDPTVRDNNNNKIFLMNTSSLFPRVVMSQIKDVHIH